MNYVLQCSKRAEKRTIDSAEKKTQYRNKDKLSGDHGQQVDKLEHRRKELEIEDSVGDSRGEGVCKINKEESNEQQKDHGNNYPDPFNPFEIHINST
jgi:hypothetical protein